jgi:dienelactone hydrolase
VSAELLTSDAAGLSSLGFHADFRASYRKEAAEDAWNQMQAWFKKYKVLN